jgi:glycerate kinase
LDAAGFEAHLEGADVVFTGEGRLDGQTLGGKVISGVARRAKQKGVPVVVVAGDVSGDVTALYKTGVAAIFSTNREARPFAEVRNRAGDDLSLVMENILRLWKHSEGK